MAINLDDYAVNRAKFQGKLETKSCFELTINVSQAMLETYCIKNIACLADIHP